MMSSFADIVLPLPLEGLFTYSVPDALAEKVKFGMRVLVPLGRSKKYVGIVTSLHQQKPDFACKDILAVLDPSPILLPAQWRLWQWMADYYLSPVGEVMTPIRDGQTGIGFLRLSSNMPIASSFAFRCSNAMLSAPAPSGCISSQ